VASAKTLVLDVPSVIVPLERNVLLNPAHPAIEKVKARNLGRFQYDARLRPVSKKA
jgi:RES domain-containing protein